MTGRENTKGWKDKRKDRHKMDQSKEIRKEGGRKDKSLKMKNQNYINVIRSYQRQKEGLNECGKRLVTTKKCKAFTSLGMIVLYNINK